MAKLMQILRSFRILSLFLHTYFLITNYKTMKIVSTQIVLFLFLYSCGNDKIPNIDSVNDRKDLSIKKSPTVTNVVKDTVNLSDTLSVSDSSSNDQEIGKDEKFREPEPEIKSITELWEDYKFAKDKIAEFVLENDLDSIPFYLNLSSDIAYELGRVDLAILQLNNIGYYSINEFKNRTDYDKRIHTLVTFYDMEQKAIYANETIAIFKRYFRILNRAKQYITKAKILDSEFEPSERTKNIAENVEFIEWIRDYISNTNKPIRSENIE